MGLRRLLGMRSRARQRGKHEIDAMIVQGDFDRAETQLRARIHAHPNSLGYRVKLADLLARNQKPIRAAMEYVAVAEAHARNEAYNPAIRLVEKALQLAPGNIEMTTRLVQLERLRQAFGKRSVIFGRLEHATRPPGSKQSVTSSRLLEFWPSMVQSALVQALSADQLGALFAAVEPIRMGRHAAVMRQGQIISRGHWIAGGAIEATIPGPGGRQLRLTLLKPGEFFGEASLLDNAQCPANYRTLGDDTTVLRLTKRALDSLLMRELGSEDLLAALRRFGCDGRVLAAAEELTNS